MGYTKSDGLLVLANGEIIEDPAKVAQQVSDVVSNWVHLFRMLLLLLCVLTSSACRMCWFCQRVKR
jgi:Mg2+/Co2+ transporter CorB